MSSFVWLIEIEGNTTIDDYEIMSALSKHGLSVGRSKLTLNTDLIEQQLKAEINEISWINIKLNGTRATVFITEDIPDTNIVDNFSPCDIISDKEALITEIIANTGTPAVKVGDVVKEGDVLISGDVTYTLDGVETLYKQVYSSGTIKGEVTRQFNTEVPYTVSLKRYTGKKKIFLSISLFTTKFNTNFLKNDINWEKYDIIREVTQPTLGTRFTLPVIADKTLCRQYNEEYMNITEDEAQKLAEKLINKEILNYYRTEDDIISKEISFSGDNDRLIAKATVVSVENLGKTSYIFSDVATGGNAVNGATEDTNSE
jgi:similar to stage IV sporulation protein